MLRAGVLYDDRVLLDLLPILVRDVELVLAGACLLTEHIVLISIKTLLLIRLV